MRFVDEVEIEIKSGHGGAGAVHFMRQKFMPNMGPDGGDGGRGGDVVFVATSQLQSLLDFQFNSKYHAEDGENGMGSDRNGRGGLDLVVKVPIGTLIKDADSGEIIADLVEPEVPVTILKGGIGGLGNMNFATPTRQAPDFAQPGRPGQIRRVRLELKLLADVGLVGFPNAGKSTLISRWSAARPKIADYPFTTLVPNLGVVRAKGMDFVLADVPGIIEGAAEGRGLGIQFLRHIERTRVLIILLDLDPYTGRNLLDEYHILMRELGSFSAELGSRPMILACNKIDAFTSNEDQSIEDFLGERGLHKLEQELGYRPHIVSCVAGHGLEQLQLEVVKKLQELGPRSFSNDVNTELLMGNAALFGSSDQED